MSEIDAKTLFLNSKNAKIMNIVDEIHTSITDKLIDSSKAGLNYAIYDLPRHNFVDSINKADLEIIIFSELISRLEKKGLKVIYDPSKYKIKIIWPATIDSNEIGRRKKIITEHLGEL